MFLEAFSYLFGFSKCSLVARFVREVGSYAEKLLLTDLFNSLVMNSLHTLHS